MKIVTVIPARGGSKEVPKKNLRKVCGRTLLAHTLECAARSKHPMDVVLSTDCSEILEHARSIGYSGEYLRPSRLAQDDSRIVDAVLDVLFWSERERSRHYDVVVLLQPTSPLRLSSDLDAALDMFLTSDNARSLVSVNPIHEHPVECVVTSSHGWKYLVEPEKSHAGRQSYNQNYFFINGAIYICTREHLTQTHSFIDYQNSILYQMPRVRAIDIDTEEDLIMADFLCNRSKLI